MRVKGKKGGYDKSRIALLLEAVDTASTDGVVERAHEKIDRLTAIVCNMLARDGVSDEEFLKIIESSYVVSDK